MAVKSKGSILQQGTQFVQASSMRDELNRLKAEKEKNDNPNANLNANQKGGVGRPRKTKVNIASKRPMQVSTHYTYDVKEKIEDVVRRMKREGVKTASNEEIIFIAVSEWLEKNADAFSVDKFMEYRKELEE